MEEHLRKVALSKQTPEDYANYLGLDPILKDLADLMNRTMRNRKRKKEAEVWIEYYLGEFESGLKDGGVFVENPLLINRMILFVRTALSFVPRGRWRKVRLALLRMEYIAAATSLIRDRMALAHGLEPHKMACSSEPATVNALLLPD